MEIKNASSWSFHKLPAAKGSSAVRLMTLGCNFQRVNEIPFQLGQLHVKVRTSSFNFMHRKSKTFRADRLKNVSTLKSTIFVSIILDVCWWFSFNQAGFTLKYIFRDLISRIVSWKKLRSDHFEHFSVPGSRILHYSSKTSLSFIVTDSNEFLLHQNQMNFYYKKFKWIFITKNSYEFLLQ